MSHLVYTAPSKTRSSFHCPHCQAFAQQKEEYMRLPMAPSSPLERFSARKCEHCGKVTIWHEMTMIWPTASSAPPAHPDLPDDCKPDFEEARVTLSLSPRSSAGLLRLVIQKLMIHLGQPGKNINRDIGALVENGLPVSIQQALDACRIVGNEAVHPGSLDLNATPEIAHKLFELVNFIVEKQISEPKKIQALYEGLPADKLKGVSERDS